MTETYDWPDGTRRAFQVTRWPVGLVLLVAGFTVAVAATNTLDARYLLPFAVPIYLAQAIGGAWIVQTLACRSARPI